MNCNEYQERASMFVDGELELRDQIDLFTHLTQCSVCRAFVDSIVRMKEIQRKEQITYPDELDDAILSDLALDNKCRKINRFENRERKHFWQKRLMLPVSLAVVAIIVALIAGILFGEILIRKSEVQAIPANWLQSQAQPTTVIMIYGIPPVEVFGKSLVQAKNNIQYQN